ncbi:hypothetical protein [Gemmatimonas sp.]|uniref:hypothetical protein n=1 Tax=Gemmatimonas sp. TaxID=1962908 RepID=UPI0037C0B380
MAGRSTRARRGGGVAALMLAVAVVGLVACDGAKGRNRWLRDGETFMRDAVQTGRLADTELDESSGMVASVAEPGVFWSQNDSGNDEHLFAYDSTGRARGRVLVRGGKNRDWEALTTGPCAEGQCLVIGDVGDNLARRNDLTLYQIAEPPQTAVSVPVLRTLSLRYADAPHDVEAMYAGPDGTLWLVTKRPQRGSGGALRPVRVYEVPRTAWDGGEYTARVVDSLPVTPEKGKLHDWVTDASLSPLQPDGRRRVVLLTYGAVYVFDADPATGRPGALMARCTLPIREDTAESVAWLGDGRIQVGTEGTGGAIYRGRCP